MSDSEKTIFSGGGAGASQPSDQPAGSKKSLFLILGGIGCLLLLCAALLIGGGIYFVGDRFDDVVALLSAGNEAATVVTATVHPSPTALPTEAEATEEPTTEADTGAGGTEQPAISQTPTSAGSTPLPASVEPEISSITFALGATEEYEPVDPGVAFEEGITEIHAIFDYSGMSADYTWERVWYLDGAEILRNSAEWTGDEGGRFDYFIDAGGAPLSPGEWLLELYVEGELLATGSFTIEAEEAPEIAEADDSAEHAADLSSPTPEPSPTITPSPSPTQVSTSSGPGGGTFQLAYTKWDGGQHNLYVADTNGNNEQFILGRAAGPSWTPDGSSIFFYGEAGVDRQIVDGVEYVLDGVSNGIVSMDASPLPQNISEVRLFQGLDWKQGTARWANVSPDGQMVAFDAKPGGPDYRIYFLGTVDNQQFRFEILGEQADWSPDSQRVVYRSGRDGVTGLWISNRDDSGHTNITQGGSDSFPAWSPDGTTIAFSREQEGNVDIYTVNVDGSNPQRLTDAPGPDTLPVYTPSGDLIFRSARSGSWGIWKMSGSGADQTVIIPDAGVGPDWTFSRMSVR